MSDEIEIDQSVTHPPKDQTPVRLKGTARYGSKYWRVDMNKHAGEAAAQIYVMADSVEFKDGAVIFWGGFRENADDKPIERIPTLAIGADHWSFIAPVSAWDGSEVAIDHWHPIDPKTGKPGEDRFHRGQ